MRIFKSKAYRSAERDLSAAQTQEQVTTVRDQARTALKPKEFGHFLRKVTSRRANEAATCPPLVKREIVDEISKRLEVSQDEKLLRIILRMLS